MLRRVLAVAILVGLAACGVMHMPLQFHSRVARVEPQRLEVFTVPKLAQGLWAVLDPGCPKPSAPNVRQWPACASPVWINRDKAVVIRSDAKGPSARTDASFAADLNITPGDPLIAQVGTQKDGYLFLVLTHLAKDDQGRLIGAVGAAVACPKPTQGGMLLKPSLNGCDTESLDDVRKAAMATLQDRAALTEVAWIAPGAP